MSSYLGMIGRKLLSIFLVMAAITAGTIVYVFATPSTTTSSSAAAQDETNADLGEEIGRHLIDTETISLSGVLHKDDFKLLMDTTPYESEHAHVALKVPCGHDGEQRLTLVAGVAPDVSPVSLDFVAPLSDPPNSCVYHGDIGMGVTDIALLNTSKDSVVFGVDAGYSATITFHGEAEHEDEHHRG